MVPFLSKQIVNTNLASRQCHLYRCEDDCHCSTCHYPPMHPPVSLPGSSPPSPHSTTAELIPQAALHNGKGSQPPVESLFKNSPCSCFDKQIFHCGTTKIGSKWMLFFDTMTVFQPICFNYYPETIFDFSFYEANTQNKSLLLPGKNR